MDQIVSVLAVLATLIVGIQLMLGNTGQLYRISVATALTLTACSAYLSYGALGLAGVLLTFTVGIPLAICTVTRVIAHLAWVYVRRKHPDIPANAKNPSHPLSYSAACRLIAGRNDSLPQ